MSEQSRIPATWQWSIMGEVAEIVSGGTPKTDRPEYFGGDIPWITPADLSNYTEKYISHGARNITEVGLENSGARLMPAGTVLFSSRAPIGYVAIAANPVSTNQGFKSFILPEGLIADFVYYYLQHAKNLAVELGSGTTFLEISSKKIAQIPIPVAPLEEQHRIVAEIEKQFTRLEAGKAALRRLQANLKRYRASIVKAACHGRLLLDNHKQPKLPVGWITARLDEICESVTDGDHQPPPKQPDGIPFLTIGNVSSGKLDFSNTRFVSETYFQQLKPTRVPKPGDVLYTVVATIGIPVLVTTDRPFCFQRHIALLRPSAAILPKYLWLLMSNPDTFQEAWQRATGSNQPTLPLKALRSLSFSLPPITEQEQIIGEVERRLSVIEEMETVVSVNLQRSEHLRQSILQRAFHGELVAQYPEKGSAARLLEKIKEARQKMSSVKPKPRRSQPKPMQSKPVKTLAEMLERLDAIGGAAEPERLLLEAGLGDDANGVDVFFDLLREGRRAEVLVVPIGTADMIRRNKHAN